MNSSKLADYSEIISSIAVVVTLVILVFEVKNNTEEVRAATMSDIAGRTQEFTIAHMTNPEIERVWSKMTAGSEINEDERLIANSLLIAITKIAEESYVAYKKGRLDEEIWLTRGFLAIVSMNAEYTRDRWRTRLSGSDGYVPIFQEWVNTTLKERYGE